MTVWTDPHADWTSGDGEMVVQLLERAYVTVNDVARLAEQVGLGITAATDIPELLHDAWLWVLNEAVAKDRVLDIAAELLQDRSRDQFHAPLRGLLGNDLGRVTALRVLRHGLPAGPSEIASVVGSLPESQASVAEGRSGLESIGAASASQQDTERTIRILLDARRRVGLIRKNGSDAGTGFLIAPDLVMTAAHVLGYALPPTTVASLEFVVDYYDHRTSAAETGTPVPVAEYLTGLLPTDDEINGGARPFENVPADRLDFAVLRLATPIGAQPTPDGPARGYYELHPEAFAFGQNQVFEIFHHPEGAYQQQSETIGGARLNPLKTRFRYTARTTHGSSGAPVLDKNGRLVGIHHFSTKTESQAVPIWLIASAIASAGVALPAIGAIAQLLAKPADAGAVPAVIAPAAAGAAPAQAEDPIGVLQVGPSPFVNRTTLRDNLRNMPAPNGATALAIQGPVDSGVTTSYDLLAHVASRSRNVPGLTAIAADGLKAIRIDLRKRSNLKLAACRKAIISEILQQLESGHPEQTIAQVAWSVDNFKTFCEVALRGSKVQRWIFVDSVDEMSEIQQHGVDEILSALLTLSRDPQLNLRVVVAGREAAAVSHEALQWNTPDVAAGLTRDEVRKWLLARAAQEKRDVDQARLEQELDRLIPGDVAVQPLELALQLPSTVFKVLDDN